MAKDWIDGFIARDEHYGSPGRLHFFETLPIRLYPNRGGDCWHTKFGLRIPLVHFHSLGKDLTWADEPKPVKFVAVEE